MKKDLAAGRPGLLGKLSSFLSPPVLGTIVLVTVALYPLSASVRETR